MPTRVVLTGDTHLPRFGRVLPSPLVAGLRDAQLVLHAGDITQPFVLELLGEHAPVVAVAGNNDPPELLRVLGQRRVVEVEETRLGLTHGHLGPGRTTRDRALRAFPPETDDSGVDAVCFGHSHVPLVERVGGRWLLNPGSPTDRRRQPTFSYIIVVVDGRSLRPELVRFGGPAG